MRGCDTQSEQVLKIANSSVMRFQCYFLLSDFDFPASNFSALVCQNPAFRFLLFRFQIFKFWFVKIQFSTCSFQIPIFRLPNFGFFDFGCLLVFGFPLSNLGAITHNVLALQAVWDYVSQILG